MNTLLYLLYGKDEEFHLELSYSVLTAIARCGGAKDFRIVLACDEGNGRVDLPVEHLVCSSGEFADWTFGGRFGHGAKIGALRKAAALHDGKVALIDTDTWFLKSPAEIFARIDAHHVVMHHYEGPLARHGQWPIYRALMNSGRHRFDENGHMFNSGVVGISSEQAALLEDAAALTRELVDAAGPVHTLEQFSLGLVLGSHCTVRTADDVVRHYIGWKRRFVHERIRAILPEFTKSAFGSAPAGSHDAEAFPRWRRRDAVRAKIRAWRRRGLDEYAFAYLCYLSAFNATSRSEANAWAGTALDFVTWNKYPPGVVAEDFSAMRPDRLASLEWLDPRVRDRWLAYWREVTTTSPAAR